MPKTIAEELAEKTFRELAEPEKPTQRSRMSQTPNGYIHLIAWSNASLLRIFVRAFTKTLPQGEHRLKAQLDDAARSVVPNIEEGYSRPTTSSYLDFLGYSQASLIEVKGDVQRSLQDGFLLSSPGSSLQSMGIDLRLWHESLKQSVISKGVYRNIEEIKGKYQSPLQSFRFLYDPVDTLRAKNLTYEIFIELINKTDWNLRKLVSSLESKLGREQKFYQVEQARIKSNLHWNR